MEVFAGIHNTFGENLLLADPSTLGAAGYCILIAADGKLHQLLKLLKLATQACFSGHILSQAAHANTKAYGGVEMRRRNVFLWIPCIFVMLLWGCRPHEPEIVSHLVTQVEITCQQKNVHFTRHYTDPQKMKNILLYLRLVKRKPISQSAPLRDDGEIYQIRIRRADNSEIVYKQKDHRYLAKEPEPWQEIEPEQAEGLYRLMRQMESDAL